MLQLFSRVEIKGVKKKKKEGLKAEGKKADKLHLELFQHILMVKRSIRPEYFPRESKSNLIFQIRMDVSERLRCITQRLPRSPSASLNIKRLTNKTDLIKKKIKKKP